ADAGSLDDRPFSDKQAPLAAPAQKRYNRDMAPPSPAPPFRPLFERWAGRVRARLALGPVIGGAALGLLLGAGVSAMLWQTRHGALRPGGGVAGLVGAGAGFAVPRRRRWDAPHVALSLDARLDADEAIATAVELDKKPDQADDSSRAVVISQATRALA